MAVVLIVELGESPQLDLDLNTLQFVGIADHSQLKNRDLAEQHPIEAITGLSEKHTAYDQTLATFDEVLTEHTQTLALQSQSLEEQSQELSSQGESITNMDETLQEHSLALAELDEFANNIATQNNVQEVLENA